MKKCFLNWNKDTVEDDVIFKHLLELSDGKIDLQNSGEDLSDSQQLLKSKKRFSKQSTGKNKGGSKISSNRNRKR
ncbi:MAG: DUF4290 domain-containing protein, partial [Bacteroidetes bacterium]